MSGMNMNYSVRMSFKFDMKIDYKVYMNNL